MEKGKREEWRERECNGRIQFSSSAVFRGGPGRLTITSDASCDF